jgi:hypothetical protein
MTAIGHNATKELKTCDTCKRDLPKSSTFFYRNRRLDKLRDTCKDCIPIEPRGVERNTKDKVLERYEVNQDGCWIYTGKKDRQGYGVFYYQQSAYKAHRIAYEVVKGPIPYRLVLDHLCKVKPCINPDHLEAVDQAENVKRWYKSLEHCAGCTCSKDS